MADQLHEALRRYFSFDNFLDHQQEVVEAVLSGKDFCVIMPTGAGKSLCYQLPLLLKEGYGIIVSPLIALMKDQIDALKSKGIPSGVINSSIDYEEQRNYLRAATRGEIKLLYVAPERFGTESFQRFLAENTPSTLIVDEAHCISQWGHDFRPAYTRLGTVAETYHIPQVCAFTATATLRVRDDIQTQLKRPEMEFLVAGFKRPNLAFKVIDCRSTASRDEALTRLLQEPVSGATIIYAATRKQVDELTRKFQILRYHAGLSDEERNRVQEAFMSEPNPVLAATNAFGMGIDRHDVRRVIHYNMTGSLEAYYQEAGRAGRDGEPAECILLFNYGDRYVQEFLIEMNNPEPELLKRLYQELHRLHERSVASGGDGILEIPVRELALRLAAKNDSAIYTALRVLEHCGVLERISHQDSAGTITLLGDATILKQLHTSEQTQRSRFLHRFLQKYGTGKAVATSFSKLSELTGLTIDQLKRVLRYLDGETVAWVPAPPGSGIRLLHPENATLNVDFTELARKRDFELGRLEDVIAYAQTKGCRQAALIGYFGEKSQYWECGACDNCDRRSKLEAHASRTLNEMEKQAVLEILSCIARYNARFGRGKISLLLSGARRTEILNLRLERSEYFGALKRWKQEEILEFLRALEQADLLRTTNSDYPCLVLAPAGKDFLDAPGELSLPLAPNGSGTMTGSGTCRRTRSGSRSTGSTVKPLFSPEQISNRHLMERNDLWERLRTLRMQMAQAKHCKPFQIFSDATLQELVLKMPLTMEESSRIRGIGPVKAKEILPKFLECIARFREDSL